MKTENLYINKEDCCGCEACAQVCPMQIIELSADSEGFLYPNIESDQKCIDCKKCIKVCPVKSSIRHNLPIIAGFGGSMNNSQDIKSSSSGGFATLISRRFIHDGGVVYGVRYSADFNKVVYSKATKEEQLEKFRSSKYVQAEKNNIFQSVKADLAASIPVLFIGLPCEISGLYNFIGYDDPKLFTAALICHGPTSQKVHKEFCDSISINKKINYFSVREKITGWKPYYLKVGFSDGSEYVKPFKGTDYEVAFQYLKRPSCSSCRYKYGDKLFGSISDITLGDFHSANKKSSVFNPWGTSQLCVHTNKGKFLANLLDESNCNKFNVPKDSFLSGNIAFIKPIKKPKFRNLFSYTFVDKSLYDACKLPAIQIHLKILSIKKRLFSMANNLILKVVKNKIRE